MKDKQYTFRTNPSYVSVFQDLGVDVVSLANNHTLDFGETALLDSLDTLDQAGIASVGAGENLERAKQIEYRNVNGRTIAILAASRVIPVVEWNATATKPGMLTTYDPTAALALIKEAEEKADITVIYVHWGLERQDMPQEYQKTMAKQYIDAGADIVIGSHPHVLQGVEYYNNRPIVYSLGNYMFNATISQTAFLEVHVDEQDKYSLYMYPCYAQNGKTQQLKDEAAVQKFYDYMTSISFGVEFQTDGEIKQSY